MLGALLLALLVGAQPARADDVGAASRGVVRIVTIATVDGQVVGFSHGSGFAVAPNRVVTNAHVVELVDQYPDNVLIGVVPSEGAQSMTGRIVAIDRQRDLALIEFTGEKLPPLTLFTGPVADGSRVLALGYPGNVDLATAQSADDYIKPVAPVRTEGGYSGIRTMSGVATLLHTANIARGNSGGPLLDPCGRVIGVNSALARAEEGDSSFGFAIADKELVAFLTQAKQHFQATSAPCTTMAQLLTQDQEADAAARAQLDATTRDALAKTQAAHEDALVRARDEQQRQREDAMGIAALLLALGVLVVEGAGLLEVRHRRQLAIWLAAGGVALMAGAVVIFVNRPEGPVKLVENVPLAAASAPVAAGGAMLCSFVPERSRITVSQPADVKLDIGADGCVNGRTQYADENGKLVRVLVPNEEQTVSVLRYDPATRAYVNDHYFLGAEAMAAMRKLRGDPLPRACTADPALRSQLASRQAAIRATLPPMPDERLTYSCKPG